MKEKKYFLGIGLIAGLIVSGSLFLNLFQGIEFFLEDLLVSPKPVSPEIIVVAIDDESISKIGQWPWPREVFGQALERLNTFSPKVVGIDVIFAEPSRLGGADDAALENALQKITFPVVLPVEASNLDIKNDKTIAYNLIETLPRFRNHDSVRIGHVNLLLDQDGVARRFPREVATKNAAFPSFSEQVFRASGSQEKFNTNELSPRIVFSAPPGSIRHISFSRLLTDDLSDLIKEKIVLVGATTPDLHDEKRTPLGRGQEMPGVEIQANIINMMLAGWGLKEISWLLMVGWIFSITLLLAIIFVFSKKLRFIIIASLIIWAGSLIDTIILFDRGLVGNLVHTNLAWGLSFASLFGYRYFRLGKERKNLENIFSKYVSPSVLGEILKDPSKVRLGGEEREITVFFSDIRGFTTLSEKTTPQELVRVLNKYFTAMTTEVLNHKGVLDKYIGDAIMAFWGAPLPDDNQADNAINCSLAMLRELKNLNEELRKLGDPEINIGIGLFTGPAVVGNIGSEARFDYTVIGDTVNVSSRLEGLCKDFKVSLVVGESTKEATRGNYNFRSLGQTQVKGRLEPIRVYTIDT